MNIINILRSFVCCADEDTSTEDYHIALDILDDNDFTSHHGEMLESLLKASCKTFYEKLIKQKVDPVTARWFVEQKVKEILDELSNDHR